MLASIEVFGGEKPVGERSKADRPASGKETRGMPDPLIGRVLDGATASLAPPRQVCLPLRDPRPRVRFAAT